MRKINKLVRSTIRTLNPEETAIVVAGGQSLGGGKSMTVGLAPPIPPTAG